MTDEGISALIGALARLQSMEKGVLALIEARERLQSEEQEMRKLVDALIDGLIDARWGSEALGN